VVIAGPVHYVGDGPCIGPARDSRRWIEIRLSDFDAPALHAPGGADAKARLSGLVMGWRPVCTTRRDQQGRVFVHDRMIARCTVDGPPLGRADPSGRRAPRRPLKLHLRSPLRASHPVDH